jgi:hypothetical protein
MDRVGQNQLVGWKLFVGIPAIKSVYCAARPSGADQSGAETP